MIEGIPIADLSGPAVLAFVAALVITRRLVWHTDVKKLEERVDRLENLLMQALGVAERTTTAAEVATDVLSQLPDPAREEQ